MIDKGLKSRFRHVRELILEEQSQAKKKQKKKNRYDLFSAIRKINQSESYMYCKRRKSHGYRSFSLYLRFENEEWTVFSTSGLIDFWLGVNRLLVCS